MFGLFRRRPSPQQEVLNDIQETMVTTFDALALLATETDPLSRLTGATTRIAAMTGALRDTYPSLPVDDCGPGSQLVTLNASGQVFAALELCDAILQLVQGCPNEPTAKMNVMIFILNPASIPLGDRPKRGVLGAWSA